jgi:hypothetical protein
MMNILKQKQSSQMLVLADNNKKFLSIAKWLAIQKQKRIRFGENRITK